MKLKTLKDIHCYGIWEKKYGEKDLKREAKKLKEHVPDIAVKEFIDEFFNLEKK